MGVCGQCALASLRLPGWYIFFEVSVFMYIWAKISALCREQYDVLPSIPLGDPSSQYYGAVEKGTLKTILCAFRYFPQVRNTRNIY